MKDTFIYILTFIYGIGWIITLSGYIPTIIDLWKKKSNANITTYIMWTSTTFITSLYGFFVLEDLIFNIVINFQLLASLTVLILSIKLKYNKNQIIYTKNLKNK
jgi:hypothetical protein